MARFCTKCGKPLGPDGKCTCSANVSKGLFHSIKSTFGRLLSMCMARMGIGCSNEVEAFDVFEREKKIIPDVVTPNDGEIPVKQYNVAILRSRILGKRAEGKLQTTNKRVIFRAAGMSYAGKTSLQHEFAIEEIGGIEVKKSSRISFLNVIFGFIISGYISDWFVSIFSAINNVSNTIANILGCGLAVVLVLPFFLIRKHFWIKLFCLAASMGTLTAISNLTARGILSRKAFDYILGRSIFGFVETLLTIITFIWIFNMILVTLAPELRICIKTKSAGEAVQIRKKAWGFFRRQYNEYTDFSEVLPWSETDKAITEIGAMIDDIQTMGDLAIEKWRV